MVAVPLLHTSEVIVTIEMSMACAEVGGTGPGPCTPLPPYNVSTVRPLAEIRRIAELFDDPGRVTGSFPWSAM